MNSASANDHAHPAEDRSAEADATDATLARRAGEGDVDAAETLVLRHQAAVARLLWRFARQPAELDDLVQDTFLRMLRALPNWRHESPFAHWLLRIATNVGRDHFRHQAIRLKWSAQTLAAGEGDTPAEAADPAADPAARAAANEIKELLAQLPPDARALLTLHHLEGWELARIAAHYGWTVTATKLRAWRARRMLRALYRERFHEP